jgi:hypothetical protein
MQEKWPRPPTTIERPRLSRLEDARDGGVDIRLVGPLIATGAVHEEHSCGSHAGISDQAEITGVAVWRATSPCTAFANVRQLPAASAIGERLPLAT